MTASLMNAPGGQVLVGAIGLAVVAYGGYYVYQGWTDKFFEKLDGSPKSSEATKAYRWTGKAGHVGKGVAVGVVGTLFVWAAVTHDAQRSGGLDQAFQEVAQQPFGQGILVLIGVGVACYGIFAFLRARHFTR